jgi:hypothetical protein
MPVAVTESERLPVSDALNGMYVNSAPSAPPSTQTAPASEPLTFTT